MVQKNPLIKIKQINYITNYLYAIQILYSFNYIISYRYTTRILCSFLDFLNSNGEKNFFYTPSEINKQICIINYFQIIINLIITELDKANITKEKFKQLFNEFNLIALNIFAKLENYKLKISETKVNLILTMEIIDDFFSRKNYGEITNKEIILKLISKIPIQINLQEINEKNPKEIYEILIKNFDKNQLPGVSLPITKNSYFEFENCIENLNYYKKSLERLY